MQIKDSGERRVFPDGAVRDCSFGKGRFDLLPMFGIEAVARLLEEGANKYGERNWEGGIYNHCFIDSGMRHLSKFVRCEIDEPHLVQAAWNILCAVDQIERIKRGLLDRKYDDIGAYAASMAHQPMSGFVAQQDVVDHTHCSDYTDGCGESPCQDCDLNNKED